MRRRAATCSTSPASSKHVQMMADRTRRRAESLGDLLGGSRLVLHNPKDARAHRIADRLELQGSANRELIREVPVLVTGTVSGRIGGLPSVSFFGFVP